MAERGVNESLEQYCELKLGRSDLEEVNLFDDTTIDESSRQPDASLDDRSFQHLSLVTNSVAMIEDSVSEECSDAMNEGNPSTVRYERRRSSLLQGLWACLAPVKAMLTSEGEKKKGDEFEIAFADIKELKFIGAGAQGSVHYGEYHGKKVAVKKINDASYCDEIYKLRKLSHPNIIQFT